MTMDEGFKQRLIGACVLAALGVIFVPALFEPDHQTSLERQTMIPVAPKIEPVTIPEPAAVVGVEPAPAPEDMYQLSVDSEAHEAMARSESGVAVAESSVLDVRGVPKAWAIQVGSFKESSRAEALKQRLLKDGYDAYARSGGDMTRVFVGPRADRKAAADLKKELDAKLSTRSLIVNFTP